MLVNWKENRMKVVPILPQKAVVKGTEAEEALKAIQASSITPEGNFVFFPGWNEVPADTWTIIKNLLIEELQTGRMEEFTILKENAAGKTSSEPRPFVKISPVEARKVLENCFSLESLKVWYAEETRGDIRNAIDDRRKDLIKRPDANENQL